LPHCAWAVCDAARINAVAAKSRTPGGNFNFIASFTPLLLGCRSLNRSNKAGDRPAKGFISRGPQVKSSQDVSLGEQEGDRGTDPRVLARHEISNKKALAEGGGSASAS